MAQASTVYQYSPLDDPKSNIRLLCITHADENKIQCCLTQVRSLSEQPYHCLSYTWGDPFGRDTTNIASPIWTIFFEDGSHLPILQNLRDALLHLFRVQRDKVDAIWIDAVCIDQGNDTEKGPQIGMMHEIYSHAKTVVIWLGPDDPIDKGNIMTQHIIQVIVEENRHMKQREETSRKVGGRSNGIDGDAETEPSDFELLAGLSDGKSAALLKDMTKLSSLDALHWRALTRLSRRAYWGRLWIWQEVITSLSDPIVACGDTVFAWSELCLATHYLVAFGASLLVQMGHSDFYVDGPTPRNQPHRIANTRVDYMKPAQGAAWMRAKFASFVLENNRNDFDCFDERDRLFAHVGVCKYERLSATEYAKPFWQLYHDFWADALERSGCVNLLTYVEDDSVRRERPKTMRHDTDQEAARAMRRDNGYIPTWVPDLRARLEPLSMYSVLADVKTFNISANLPQDVNAGMRIDRQTKRLFLQGYKLDKVVQFSECEAEILWEESIPGLLELVRDLLAEPSLPYDRPAGVMDAVLTSVVLLSETGNEPQFPVPEELKTRCRKWLLDTLAQGRLRGTHNYCTVRQDILLWELEAVDTGGVIPSLLEVQNNSVACRSYFTEVPKPRESSDSKHRPDGLPNPSLKLEQPPPQASGTTNSTMIEYLGGFGLKRMRVFRTMQGWVGKGPQSLRADDELWLVPGANVTFVLRRHSVDSSDDIHTYVGHAYVHGLMSGELKEEFKGQQLEKIVLV